MKMKERVVRPRLPRGTGPSWCFTNCACPNPHTNSKKRMLSLECDRGGSCERKCFQLPNGPYVRSTRSAKSIEHLGSFGNETFLEMLPLSDQGKEGRGDAGYIDVIM